jgi:hypothetical protein
MSRASKNRRSRERRAFKKEYKARNRALYAAWRDDGENRKSKRFVRSRTRHLRWTKKNSHPLGRCGNIGCMRCNPKRNTG